MKRKIMFPLLLSASFLSAQCLAEAGADSQYAVGAKLGTLGAGLDLTYNVSPKVNARFNINGGGVDADGEEDGVNYTGELDGRTIGALVDYYPKAGNFRISAGLYNNGNELSLVATGSGNTSAGIGDRDYDLTGANLHTDVGFDSVAPYLGLGWGNAVKGGGKWRFSLDAGVLFQGSPEAKMAGTGTATDIGTGATVNLATDTVFQTELAKEEQELNDELEDFKVYPVISLGASYRF